MNFSEAIKALRLEHGFTLQYVADKIKVSKSTIKRWEDGEISSIGLDRVDQLAGVLNVSPGYLMGWTDRAGVPLTKADHTSDPRYSEAKSLLKTFNDKKLDQALVYLRFLAAT